MYIILSVGSPFYVDKQEWIIRIPSKDTEKINNKSILHLISIKAFYNQNTRL